MKTFLESVQSRFKRADGIAHTQFSDHKHLPLAPRTAVKFYTGPKHIPINRALHTGQGIGKYENNIRHLDHATTQFTTSKDLVVHSGVKKSPENSFKQGHNRFRIPAFTSTSLRADTATDFAQHDLGSEHHYLITHSITGEPRKATKISAQEYSVSFMNQSKCNQLAKEKGHGTGVHVARSYKHVLRIHVPAGSHGLYTASHSNYPGEREFLLPRHGAETEDGHIIHSHLEIHPRPIVNHQDGIVHWKAKLIQKKVKPENAE